MSADPFFKHCLIRHIVKRVAALEDCFDLFFQVVNAGLAFVGPDPLALIVPVVKDIDPATFQPCNRLNDKAFR
jgi:hypothetical protein